MGFRGMKWTAFRYLNCILLWLSMRVISQTRCALARIALIALFLLTAS